MYHINDEGQIKECRAWKKKCQFKHYQTESGAFASRYYAQVEAQEQKKRDELRRLMRDKSRVSSYSIIDTEATNSITRTSMRYYVHDLEDHYKKYGEDYKMLETKLLLSDSTNDHPYSLIAERRKVADFEKITLTSEWTFTTHLARNLERSFPTFKSTTETVNFDKDFEHAEEVLRKFITDNVKRNADFHTPPEIIQERIDTMMDTFFHNFVIFEEEEKGGFYAWDEYYGKKLGTFHDSTLDEIVVQEDYVSSTFRPRSFERFLKGNNFYAKIMPDVNIRVYDNECGESDAWWAINYNSKEDGWSLDLLPDKSTRIQHIPLECSEQARVIMRKFVKQEMLSTHPETIEEKAQYAGNLMDDIQEIIDRHTVESEEYRRVSIENEEKVKQQIREKNNRSIFEEKKNDKSTMKKILDLFA